MKSIKDLRYRCWLRHVNKADLVEVSGHVLNRSAVDTRLVLETGFVADELGGAGHVRQTIETGWGTHSLVQDVRKAKGDLEKCVKLLMNPKKIKTNTI